eukprot:5768204-Pyramimonas_sp.AAC.1
MFRASDDIFLPGLPAEAVSVARFVESCRKHESHTDLEAAYDGIDMSACMICGKHELFIAADYDAPATSQRTATCPFCECVFHGACAARELQRFNDKLLGKLLDSELPDGRASPGDEWPRLFVCLEDCPSFQSATSEEFNKFLCWWCCYIMNKAGVRRGAAEPSAA